MTDLSLATEPLTTSGALLVPDSPGYEESRRVHNGLVDKRPAAIVRCRTPDDVRSGLDLAARRGLEVSVRGGGHNVAGRAATDGGLMIDLAPMKQVAVDPVRQRAQVGAGVLWRELDAAAAQHGLATTGGVVSSTGVAGLTLGGGLGHLMGTCGLTVDNLRSAVVVTADGSQITASAQENPDLFWGLRGGGGNFGVVTSFDLALHPVPDVTTGLVVHGMGNARAVVRAYRDLVAGGPDELSASCGLVHGPDGEPAVALPVCWTGQPAAVDQLLRPLDRSRAALDTVDRQPYPAANQLLDEGFPRGASNYWKSAFVVDLSDDLMDVLLDAYASVPSPLSAIVLEHVHGEATRVDVTATAFPHRAPGHSVLIAAQWWGAEGTQENIAWARRTFQAVLPFASGTHYVNYLGADDGQRVRAAYGPNWARLVAVKRAWDPDNRFHLNHNVDPAPPRGVPDADAMLQ
jgi:FAD/FMN-containing dehydrogenase